MKNRVAFLYHDIFLKHNTPWGHPENKDRLISVLNELKNSSLWEKLIHIAPPKADYNNIAPVHTERYIDRIKKFKEGHLDPDTYVSKDSVEAALHAAGAVIEAIERCKSGEINRAFCAVRPPGHHAEADRGMGFCIFNNIAVGARYAQKVGYKKVFIIDFDVHHGNGTQHIFEEDDSVFFFSTHQYPHYPGTGLDNERGKGRGEGYTYNVLMRAGSGDKDYFSIYSGILPEIIKGFEPDIILVSAGYDIRAEDPLASIRISGEGIRGIVSSILSSTDKPVIFTLEGGYDLDALAESVKITIEEMLRD